MMKNVIILAVCVAFFLAAAPSKTPADWFKTMGLGFTLPPGWQSMGGGPTKVLQAHRGSIVIFARNSFPNDKNSESITIEVDPAEHRKLAQYAHDTIGQLAPKTQFAGTHLLCAGKQRGYIMRGSDPRTKTDVVAVAVINDVRGAFAAYGRAAGSRPDSAVLTALDTFCVDRAP